MTILEECNYDNFITNVIIIIIVTCLNILRNNVNVNDMQ